MPVSIAGGWDFECSGPLYYGSRGSEKLVLSYPNDVIDFMPEPVWPWVKGKYTRKGVDYFSSKPGMSGKVASGHFKFQSHIFDHDLSLPENWKETVTGNVWNLQLPGMGAVFHESGNMRWVVTVIDQDPAAEEILYEELREFRGKMVYDVDKLCAYFGYDAAFPG